MKTKNYFKKISAFIIVGSFIFYQATGQTTGLSGTASNSQGAGTGGTDNTNIGALSGAAIVLGGIQNTNVGKNAGTAITTADDNTCIGFGAGKVNTATGNSFIGSLAGFSNTGGANNAFIGWAAGYSNTTGQNNHFSGQGAGYFNTTGSDNQFSGYESGKNNTTGINSTIVGSKAGLFNKTGSQNTIVGYEAGYGVNTYNFSNNSFFGYRAGRGITTGVDNVSIGSQAGITNTVGVSNSNVGVNAGYYNTSGSYNTIMGNDAGYGVLGGNSFSNNSFFGYQAGFKITTGGNNTFTGYRSGYSTTTGAGNVAYGFNSLYSNTTSAFNTAVGYQALYLTSGAGANNTAVGLNAGFNNTTGTNNVFIGYGADAAGTYTNCAAIGNSAIINASNKVRIGNTATTVIEGQTAWTYPSDGRFKSNITENVKGLEFIKKLRPVNYKFNTQTFDQFLMQNMADSIKTLRTNGVDYTASSSVIHTGFIAQEVEQAANACGYIFDGLHVPVDANDNYSLGYSQFVVPLVKAVQELSKAADSTNTATAKNDSINDAKMQAMQNKIDQLDAIINSCCTAGKSMQQNNSNSESVANSKDVELSNKNIIVLDQNTPNPFADQTLINYFLPDNITRAQIIFLDQSGKLIKAVDLTEKGKGSLNVFANDLTSGIYTYSLIVDGQTIETKKMVKTK